MNLLALNAGSTSVKLALFDMQMQRTWSATVSGLAGNNARLRISERSAAASRSLGPADFEGALEQLMKALSAARPQLRLAAVGHRVVHGGDIAADVAEVDDDLMDRLAHWGRLAPLHQQLNLSAIQAARERFGETRHFACFDTSFHRTMPPEARLLALPSSLRALGLRRYGFHGLSYASVLRQLDAAGAPVGAERVVAAHLGGGSSLCAISSGRSIECSMGVTPLSGIPMTTRCGDLDPGALLFLQQNQSLDAARLEHLLYAESGLKALAGTSGDMKHLLEIRDQSSEAAQAVAYFCYHVRRHIGGLAAALDGIDRIVFTGGIGANAPAIRTEVCSRLRHLGVEIDAVANAANAQTISALGSEVQVSVLTPDEEAEIALHSLAQLGCVSSSDQ
ncbi:acetate/propionate family kinase [Ramlibacter sp. AN1015]|uniref:acetate/propionate family kinase n=1 Tax=Ramlibacter sp. AN1015 TaxID=3133428 RepID=UPI0030BB5DA6